ncbi:hypothetical protein MMC29_005563, partial [Sticta canariensis]|nr:hypothetical protein [Sticta canariensis]
SPKAAAAAHGMEEQEEAAQREKQRPATSTRWARSSGNYNVSYDVGRTYDTLQHTGTRRHTSKLQLRPRERLTALMMAAIQKGTPAGGREAGVRRGRRASPFGEKRAVQQSGWE